MSDDTIALPEPKESEMTMENNTGNELRPSDQQVVQALIDEHYPFDCDVIPVSENTWAIHGPIPVDGEVILAEFGTKEDAELALELLSAAQAQMSGPR